MGIKQIRILSGRIAKRKYRRQVAKTRAAYRQVKPWTRRIVIFRIIFGTILFYGLGIVFASIMSPYTSMIVAYVISSWIGHLIGNRTGEFSHKPNRLLWESWSFGAVVFVLCRQLILSGFPAVVLTAGVTATILGLIAERLYLTKIRQKNA